MLINIEVEKELDYEANFMGNCECGCNKELFNGMTVFYQLKGIIYSGCLEKYLNKNKVVL